MNRSERVSIAAETIRIGEVGSYTDAQDKTFDIRDAVAYCVGNTTIIDPVLTITYGKVDDTPKPCTDPFSAAIEIVDATTLDAAHAVLERTGTVPTILNFASAKHPGGGFQNGSLAQEEDIAYRSCLYVALTGKPEYYQESLNNLRAGLYFDKMIYTNRLVVFRDAEYKLCAPWLCNCISAPAPNRGAALANKIPESEIDQTLERRIENILELAANKGSQALILGAYGCGVFKNDPLKVAQHFHNALIDKGYANSFKQVTFAIPGAASINHKSFQECLS